MNSKRETQQRISDMSQLAGIREVEIKSGKAKGVSVIEVYNSAGLTFSVLPDMCLDIAELRYKGINIGFPSKSGLQGNQFFNALDNEFSYYWRAGMLYTCGLANAGPSCVDGGLWRTEHGRIGMIPAQNVNVRQYWDDNRYVLSMEGETIEAMICGSALKLERRIETEMDSKEIRISDKIVNLQPTPEEFMLLYHINFGHPLLDDRTRLVKGAGKVTPRTEYAASGIKEWHLAASPSDTYAEQCFFHENTADENGSAYFAIINDALGLGAYVRYSLDTLPIAVEWKNFQAHDYVLAIEPGNSYILGREQERKNGTLPVIAGYGTISFEVAIGILEGEEIVAFEEMLLSLR